MSKEVRYLYEAFNLNIVSTNLRLPSLIEKNDSIKDKVYIKEDKSSFWPSLVKSKFDNYYLKFSPNDFRLYVEGVGKFRILNGEFIFWEKLNNNVSNEDITAFLLGSALGALLIQRKILVFHGNALVKGNKAIVCIGHSGNGKSTIAYSLLKNGWKLIADDLVALSKDGYLLPGIPSIKLWDDAVREFSLDINTLRPVRKGMKKYLYIPNKDEIATKKQKLNAFCLLRENPMKGDFKNKTLNSIIINDKKRIFLILRNHCYKPRFIRGLGEEGNFFLELINIQNKIPLYSLEVPMGIKNMDTYINKNGFLNI